MRKIVAFLSILLGLVIVADLSAQETEGVRRVIITYDGNQPDMEFLVASQADQDVIVDSARTQYCREFGSKPSSVVVQNQTTGVGRLPFAQNVSVLTWGEPQVVWLSYLQQCTEQHTPVPLYGVRTTEDQIIVTYDEFLGSPVELVYNDRLRRVHIRVDVGPIFSDSIWNPQARGMALEYLRDEVLRLTSGDGPIRLGDTDMFFEFESGYPIWGPTQSMGMSRQSQNLHFGEDAYVSENLVRARGRDQIIGYDGYRLWRRR
jgi:hypothetical protein